MIIPLSYYTTKTGFLNLSARKAELQSAGLFCTINTFQ